MRNRVGEKIIWSGLAVFSPVIPLLLYFSGNWYSIFHSYSLGMFFGIISYIYFLNTLLLSCRIRYFDAVFGHDRVLVFHGYMATAAFCAAAVHLIFKLTYFTELTVQNGFGIAGLLIFSTIIFLTLVFMVNSMLSRIKFVKTIRWLGLEVLHLDYTKLKLIHNFTSVATVFISVHVLFAYATQENGTRMMVMGLWAAICILLYVYHKFIRPAVNLRNAMIVTSVDQLAPDIVELVMRPQNGLPKKYKAGQFGYFRIYSDTCGNEEHPFTISSQPGNGELAITVKNLGDYTASLKDLSKGCRVAFDGPYGVFTPKQGERDHIFIAGGIGITPFISILSEWDFAGIKNSVTLIWSTRTAQDMTHKELFERIECKNSRFQFFPVISRGQPDSASSKRIAKNMLESVTYQKDLKNTLVYICGPEQMMTYVVKELKSIGIPSCNLHYEKFSF